MVYVAPVVIPDSLLQLARAGDTDAASRLWELCAPIVRVAVSAVTDPRSADAADVIQEAALVLLEVLRESDADRGPGKVGTNPASFTDHFARRLHLRVRNYLRAERRRAARCVVLPQSILDLALSRRAASVRPSPNGRSVDRALERLSARQRSVIAGLYFGEKSIAALATDLGISPQAVTALHRRALIVLRQTMSSSDLPDPPLAPATAE